MAINPKKGFSYHDFGKAAEGFQKSLEHNGKRWPYRHEILSVPFVNCLNKENLEFIKILVLTHHKDITELMDYVEDEYFLDTRYDERLEELQPNISGLNEFIKSYSDISKEILGSVKYKINLIKNVPKDEKLWEETIQKIDRSIRLREANWLLSKVGIFGKGIMNACDYLASAGIKNILKPLPSLTEVYNFDSLTTVQERCLLDDGCVSLLHGKATYFLYKMFEEEKFKEIKNISRKFIALTR